MATLAFADTAMHRLGRTGVRPFCTLPVYIYILHTTGILCRVECNRTKGLPMTTTACRNAWRKARDCQREYTFSDDG